MSETERTKWIADQAAWINGLAGDYVEDWVGTQVAEGWYDSLVKRDAEVERLRAENERLTERQHSASKAMLAGIQRIADRDAKIVELKTQIEEARRLITALLYTSAI